MSETPVTRIGRADNPYVGPRAFHTNEMLYGRDKESSALFNLLMAERIVLLYSPSGTGKTSLIQAELVPKLQARRFRVLGPMRVGLVPATGADMVPSQPAVNQYLASALQSLEEHLPVEEQLGPADLVSLDLAGYLRRREWLSKSAGKLVLIFDQFEEILTVNPTDRGGKRAFFEHVGELLRESDDGQQIWAVFSMREEYIAALEPYLRPIPTRLGNTLRIDRLDADNARLAIQEPAKSRGLPFTEEALEQLVKDLSMEQVQLPDGQIEMQIGAYVEPVQLQVVCTRLWDRLPPDASSISLTELRLLGTSISSALGDYYNDSVQSAAAEQGVSEHELRRWIEQKLITEQGIRSQALKGAQAPGLEKAISVLVDAHLVRSETRRNASWYELSHDRLVEPVRQANRAWFQQNEAPLQHQAAMWTKEKEEGRPADGLLLRGKALRDAEKWVASQKDSLEAHEEEFLDACRTEKSRRNRNTMVISILSVVAAAAILVLVLVLYQKQQTAMHELAAAANSNLEVDPELSILLALKAVSYSISYSLFGEMDEAVEDALHRAVQTSRVRLSLPHQDGEVFGVAYDPDGRRLATASADGTAKVWDATSGKNLLTLTGHANAVRAVNFTRDGRRLATASADGTGVVWDAASGKELLILAGHKDALHDIAFSPDGQRLATASADETVKLWDATSGKELFTLAGHVDQVYGVAFSPNSQRVATASDDRTAKVWDAASGKELFTLVGHNNAVYGVAFSPDGLRVVTASADRTAKVWDAISGEKLLTLSGHTNSVNYVAFNPTGTFVATAGTDGTAKVWDAVSGKELFTLSGHTSKVNRIAFSPNGDRLASAGSDRKARLWDVTGYHTDLVYGVAFSPKSQRVATASADHTAKVWDATSGKELLTLIGHANEVEDIAFSLDSKRVATASADHTAKVWDAASGNELLTLSGHKGAVSRVAFSQDPDRPRVVTASVDCTTKIWDAISGKEIHTLSGYGSWIYGAIFSPDGQRLATASEGHTAKVWDARSGKELLALSGHTDLVWDIAFSPDGKLLATASSDRTAKVWDAVSGKELLTLWGHTNTVYRIAFSPDGKLLATASWDRTARLWDVSSGKQLLFLSHSAALNGVAFSPDGAQLATTGADKRIHIYILDRKQLLALAKSRTTRELTDEECRIYLHQDRCL